MVPLARVAAAVLLVVPVLVVPGVGAADEHVATAWTYEIGVPDPASGLVHVRLDVEGAEGAVTKFTFLTEGRREPVSNVTGGPNTPLETVEGGVSFEVDDAKESFSYDVAVDRGAFRDGEVLARVGTDFALFKAESVALAYTYQFYEGRVFENQARVTLVPPAGWDAAGPWARDDAGVFSLPAGEVLPRGYVAMGPFLQDETRTLAGSHFRYVRLGGPGAFESDMWRYLEKATPYYEAVYGDGAGQHVLVVNAPDPMFRGGLGGVDSVFVHESVDLRTFAHEMAHVHQRFATVETPPVSAMWLNEGDADYHSALSLFAAGLWGPGDVGDFLDDAQEKRDDPAFADARLPDAAYGGDLERFAYEKGAVVVRALDDLFRKTSGGTLGVGDLLARLNERHGDPTRETASLKVGNEDVRAEAESLLGADLDTWFSRYVDGTQWPDVEPFTPSGHLAVAGLRVEPARASPGEPLVVRATVTNSGTQPLESAVDVVVDGDTAGRVPVSLDVGQSLDLVFDLVAGEEGEHDVRVLYARATYRTLSAPDVGIAGTSLVPATARVGDAVSLLVFVENAGERAGTARVEAFVDDARVAESTETVVEGGETTTVTLPLLFESEGARDVRVVLVTPRGDEARAVLVDVRERDSDGDGVPDSSDAYPANGAVWERTLANDALNGTPVPWWLAVAALALAARRLRR